MKKINVYRGPYHWFLGRFFGRKYEEAAMIAQRFLRRSFVVLDVGCGDGRMEELLASGVKKIIGVDNQERPLQFARLLVTHRNIEFRKSGKSFPVQDKSMDAVVSFDVIEHVPQNQVRGFLGEMRRVLKNNGVLVLTTPNIKELRGRLFGHKVNPKHYQEFTIGGLCDLLEKNDFKVVFKTGIYVTPPVPYAEHFANVFPFYWLFLFLIKLGRVFPQFAETMLVVAKRV